jgi:cytidyltransferase-like protein
MNQRRIGILGGTFDPIHWGHLETAFAAESALKLQRVLLVASNVPPHREPPRASSYHRFAMVSQTVAGRSGWRASDLELRLHTFSYTSETLLKFHERGYAPSVLIDAQTMDVSSTQVRQKCMRGESIAGLVPDPVREHIEQHGLYSSPTPGRRASDAEPAASGIVHGEN